MLVRMISMGSLLATLLATVYGMPEQPEAMSRADYGHKTIFRYRSFEDSRPSWVSPLDSVGGINHASGSEDIYAIDRGAGFDRFIAADFDGSTEYIRASSAINTVDTENHDSFTIQAWFYAHTVSGYRCLVSNTESYKGFSLKLHDGQLRGLVRLKNGSGYVNAEIEGGSVLVNRWYYAALRVKENTTYYTLTLFLNGNQVATLNTSAHYDGIDQSVERPMVGAESAGGVGDSDFFDGYIFAVSVTNYAVGVENYLENDAIRDGSRYFGMVSYHDYLDTTDGPDHRISATINSYSDVAAHVTARWYCPLLNDQYVPQGIETNGSDRVYLTMYWMDTSGATGAYPSLIVELTTTGRLLRILQMYDETGAAFTGHVGGVAYWNNYLYVPRGDDILRYNLTTAGTYTFNPDTFANPRGDQNPIIADTAYVDCNLTPNSGISYLSSALDYTGTPVLWTGEFDETSLKSIIGFSLDAQGHINPSVQDYHFTLPVAKVQGLYLYKATASNLWFYASTSYGNNASHLYDITFSLSSQTATAWTSVFTGPAGVEDLGMLCSQVWSVSESGAKYYQKRDSSPWTQLFPFVFVYEAAPGAGTCTPTLLPSPTYTRTPTRTLTPTEAPTKIPTATQTSTPTKTATLTPTRTSSFTPTRTASPTLTATLTPPNTAVPSEVPTPPPSLTPACVRSGDVNQDGTLTAGDASIVFQIALGMYQPTYLELCAADCNGDFSVTAGDAQAVFFAALGIGACVEPPAS